MPPPVPSLFLSQAWFELLRADGLPADARHTTFHAGTAGLPLLRNGSTFRALSNFYSPEFGFIDGAAPAADALAALGLRLREAGARMLQLTPVHDDAPWLSAFEAALRGAGFATDRIDQGCNWYLTCDGLRWTDYLEARPSRLRNTLRRCRKKLDASGMSVSIVRDPGAALEAALHDYQAVYAASWKSPEPFPEFIPALIRLAAAQGWLRLGVLRLNDAPAAAQLWFVKDGTASIYKLAYDARFAKQGVGTVLTAAMFEEVLDADRVSLIDFLTGDDAYKAEWMSHRRALVTLLAFDRRHPLGWLHAARHFGPRLVRRMLRLHQA